jgi:hypothetical protein
MIGSVCAARWNFLLKGGIQEEVDYVKDISFGETCETVLRIMASIEEQDGIQP